MSTPSTLLELAGGAFAPPDWSNCALVLIDFQNEYVNGAMPLGQAGAKATENARLLLNKAREQNVPIFHITHHGAENGPVFDPLSANVDIVSDLQPQDDETIITKNTPMPFMRRSLTTCLKKRKSSKSSLLGL
ncbi:hypothetical protein Psyaliredsea_00870 [Psychrobacter alimentarius]